MRHLLRASLVLALASAFSAHAQPVVGTDEHLASDRPEAWAMNYVAATTFLTAFGEVPKWEPWQWSLSGDLGSIPELSDDQRRVGFNGIKLEDLNKSPVFGRLRFALGLPYGWVAELAYTPPLEINGARPRNLLAGALGHRVFEQGEWSLSARAFGQYGHVTGDITCPAELANVTDPVRNPYGCQAPSNDRINLNYLGGDVIGAWTGGPWHAHADLGLVRTYLDVQVDALTNDTRDRSHLTSRETVPYIALGGRRDLSRHWSVAAEAMYVPLYVRRPPGLERENDSLTSLRLQLRYER
ncbi:MAG TPA: hypothetical protein VN680_01950 [Burkholderiaceae bacterium]|jgi:hypothetical protein|nr:hypothetical protein [Burkholderiaceae bacterium]